MFELPEEIQLHNIVETAPHLGTGPETLLRLPESLRVHLNDNAKERAFHSTGCELRFRLKSPSFKIKIQTCDIGGLQHGGGLAQVLFGDFSHGYVPIILGENEFEFNAPVHDNLAKVSDHPLFHPELVRILFPTHAAICGIDLTGDFAAPEPGDIPARRALHHGSSITHGSGSITSRETWAGISARNMEADLINLGLGGGCHCEPEMTDYLCSRNDFDYAVLETGINMLGLDPDTANANIRNLIRKFTTAHADKPVFFVGVFPCHNDVANNYQGRAQEIREFVEKEVKALNQPHAHFIDGKQALDPRTGLTTDLTHPSPAGMIQIGDFVSSEIKKVSPHA
ncbi:SGNH/GDSL hydrolase family protein [Kiritimatiellaeota bacterium B1221]|nr:SGNH/GDSL hydrolase family protein [Kiritimatiellaeota bacterium B1221]